MAKPQLARMKRQPPHRIGSRAVFPIADDRMTTRCQLHANLMLAPGFELELEQRFVPMRSQHAVMRDCRLATLIDPMNLK